MSFELVMRDAAVAAGQLAAAQGHVLASRVGGTFRVALHRLLLVDAGLPGRRDEQAGCRCAMVDCRYGPLAASQVFASVPKSVSPVRAVLVNICGDQALSVTQAVQLAPLASMVAWRAVPHAWGLGSVAV